MQQNSFALKVLVYQAAISWPASGSEPQPGYVLSLEHSALRLCPGFGDPAQTTALKIDRAPCGRRRALPHRIHAALGRSARHTPESAPKAKRCLGGRGCCLRPSANWTPNYILALAAIFWHAGGRDARSRFWYNPSGAAIARFVNAHAQSAARSKETDPPVSPHRSLDCMWSTMLRATKMWRR